MLLLPEKEQFSASYWTGFPFLELWQQVSLPWMAGDTLQLRMVSVWAVNSLQLLLRKLAAVLA